MTSARVLAMVLIVACLALAWPVLRLGLAAWYGAQEEVVRAFALASVDARAAGAVAAERLGRGDAMGARQAALRALATVPMDGRAWSVLGLALAADGAEAAAAVMGRAAEVAPRNTVARAWLLQQAWTSGDAPAFRYHLDALLRVDPDLIPQLAGPLSGLIGTELGLALRQLLAERLPWRAALWQAWWRVPGRSTLFHAYLGPLAAGGGLSRAEAMAWSHALERDGAYDPLAWLWQQGNREDGVPAAARLTDGDFARPPAGFGLGWRLIPVPGVSAVFSSGSGPSPAQSALVLQFAGQRAPFEHLLQLLRLPPGVYTLRYQVRADGLRTAHGLQWVAYCLPGWQELAAGPLAKGRHDWRVEAMPLVVPASGCTTQALRLRLRALGPSDQWAVGGLRYAAMRLDPVD